VRLDVEVEELGRVVWHLDRPAVQLCLYGVEETSQAAAKLADPVVKGIGEDKQQPLTAGRSASSWR
jgi:hypothetical protein